MILEDLRPPLHHFERVFARLAEVTPLGGEPVLAAVLWREEEIHPTPGEMNVGSSPRGHANRRMVCDIRRDQVAAVPKGSTIEGGPVHNVRLWTVHTIENETDPDYHKVVVV